MMGCDESGGNLAAVLKIPTMQETVAGRSVREQVCR